MTLPEDQASDGGERSRERRMLEVLFQDEHFVVVSKPGGLLVHRSREAAQDDTFLVQELREQLGRYVNPVHRLDRATSGVIAFAFSSEATRLLQAALSEPSARKEYLVLCRGLTPESWESERPLSNRAKVKQTARTLFERLAYFSRMSLLKARIFTGRRHQIRRHLAHCAHQVIGDTSYGKGRINQALRDAYGLPRMFLHARLLVVRHPYTGAQLRIEATLAPDLRAFLERLPDFDPGVLESLGGESER